jgi:hypothetical protein
MRLGGRQPPDAAARSFLVCLENSKLYRRMAKHQLYKVEIYGI